MKEGDILRYRCHTGHAFTSAVLPAEQSARIEEPLRTALRMFEERQNLLATMKGRMEGRSSSALSERTQDAQVHIDRIRAMLKATDDPIDIMKGGDRGEVLAQVSTERAATGLRVFGNAG